MQILNVKWVWNVPNVLSLLRIVLIVPFLVLYLTGHEKQAFLVLALSGISDMVDGFVARHFNQITDCGKLLDPLSDKLTQVAVVVALTYGYPQMLPLTALCFFKESCQAIGAVVMLKLKLPVRGSMWYGKLSTIVFYLCMLVMVIWPTSPLGVNITLIAVSTVFMLVAFVGYSRMFFHAFRHKDEEEVSPQEPAIDETIEKG